MSSDGYAYCLIGARHGAVRRFGSRLDTTVALRQRGRRFLQTGRIALGAAREIFRRLSDLARSGTQRIRAFHHRTDEIAKAGDGGVEIGLHLLVGAAAMVEETSAAARNLNTEVESLAKKAGHFHLENGAVKRPARIVEPVSRRASGYVSPVKALPVAAMAKANGNAALQMDASDWKDF